GSAAQSVSAPPTRWWVGDRPFPYEQSFSERPGGWLLCGHTLKLGLAFGGESLTTLGWLWDALHSNRTGPEHEQRDLAVVVDWEGQYRQNLVYRAAPYRAVTLDHATPKDKALTLLADRTWRLVVLDLSYYVRRTPMSALTRAALSWEWLETLWEGLK